MSQSPEILVWTYYGQTGSYVEWQTWLLIYEIGSSPIEISIMDIPRVGIESAGKA